MLNKFKKTIKGYRLLRKGDVVLVGVSGGPDSVVLLFLLKEIRDEFSLKLYIAHFDHRLRPNSVKDAEFVKRLGENLKIPVTVGRMNGNDKAGEEFCRQERFKFFVETAKKIKADKVCLGHNLDDQAETVLMRLIRGSGLNGLSAISPIKKIGKFNFIRPLIEIKRSEIEKYILQKKVSVCRDETNKEDLYFRNRVRKELIPLLEKKYNKNIKNTLASLAQSVSLDYDYLSQQARKTAKSYRSKLSILKALNLHQAILRIKIRQLIAEVQGDTRRISFKHIKEIEDLLLNRPIDSIVDLPKGVFVRKTKNFLIFSRVKIKGTGTSTNLGQVQAQI